MRGRGGCCIKCSEFSSLHLSIDQTNKYTVMITKKRYAKIVNFTTPRAGEIVLACGHNTLVLGIGQTKWVIMSREFDDPQVCDPV